MSSQHPPLTCAQVKTILKNLGFSPRQQRSGTTHEQWTGNIGGKFKKVTVDCPNAPFSQDLISSMARQAGVTKKQFYAAHDITQATKALVPAVITGHCPYCALLLSVPVVDPMPSGVTCSRCKRSIAVIAGTLTFPNEM